MVKDKIKFEKECPICGKILKSTNGKPALETNFKAHMRKHKLLNKMEDKK